MTEIGSETTIIKKKRPTSFWLAIILGILLGLSLLLNLCLIIALASKFIEKGISIADFDRDYQEVFVMGERTAQDKILRIPVSGPIISISGQGMGCFWGGHEDIVESIITALKKAKDDHKIKAIIFEVNSPGGGITECDQIHKEIQRFKGKRPEVPIIVSMGDMAASGGYYISAPANKIIARPTTLTGSIGVIAYFMNIEDLYQKIGLKDVVIKSGDKKDMGSVTREMTEEEKTLFQEMIDEMYQRFIRIIDEGRQNLNHEEIQKLADGRVYTGEQALKNGLVDELGDLEDSVATAKKLANLTEAKVVGYKKHRTFFDLFEMVTPRSNAQLDLLANLDRLVWSKNIPRLFYMWISK